MELYENVSVMLRPPKICKVIYVCFVRKILNIFVIYCYSQFGWATLK